MLVDAIFVYRFDFCFWILKNPKICDIIYISAKKLYTGRTDETRTSQGKNEKEVYRGRKS